MQALVGFWRSLSGRLLVLTVIFVMLAEILIFVPSVARFRQDYLIDKLDRAQIASLSVLAARGPIDPQLEAELLARAEVLAVAVRRENRRELMLAAPMSGVVDETYDLRSVSAATLIWDALDCAFQLEPRLIRVIGHTTLEPSQEIEIVVEEAGLKAAMLEYGWRIFLLSLVISAITAVLVFLSVNQFLVRPIRRVIASLTEFRDDPEDAGRIIEPSGVGGELGLAEQALAEQQHAVAKALQQKSRLAALGEAVAKINHDLRNILASAQLLADRLEESRDPAIARIGPKLVGSLDRAIRLCKQTLAFGRADEPPPQFEQIQVAAIAEEVAAALDLPGGAARAANGRAADRRAAHLAVEAELAGGDNAPREGSEADDVGRVAFVNGAPDGIEATADPDQLFRALLNLVRNAKQAIEASGRSGVIAIEARRAAGGLEIDVVDNGPGLPQKTKENLFKAFKGSVRKGGTGLGMAIAAELVRIQGGELRLVDSSEAGARFRIRLPNRGGSALDARAVSTPRAAPPPEPGSRPQPAQDAERVG